jgi:hypothetical protein
MGALPGAGKGEDGIARGEAGDAGADLGDDARELGAEYRLAGAVPAHGQPADQLHAGRKIAAAHPHVARADGGGMDAHQHLAGPGIGAGQIDQLEHLRPAIAHADIGFHGSLAG